MALDLTNQYSNFKGGSGAAPVSGVQTGAIIGQLVNDTAQLMQSRILLNDAKEKIPGMLEQANAIMDPDTKAKIAAIDGTLQQLSDAWGTETDKSITSAPTGEVKDGKAVTQAGITVDDPQTKQRSFIPLKALFVMQQQKIALEQSVHTKQIDYWMNQMATNQDNPHILQVAQTQLAQLIAQSNQHVTQIDSLWKGMPEASNADTNALKQPTSGKGVDVNWTPEEQKSIQDLTTAQSSGDQQAFTEALRGASPRVADRFKSNVAAMGGQVGANTRNKNNQEGMTNSGNQKVVESYQTSYTSDTKKLTERQQYADSAQETLNLAKNGNPISAEAAKTQIARLAGEVGVLTDRDVERFGGSKAITARVAQAAQQAQDGTLTEENAKYLQGIVDAFRTAVTNQKRERAKVYVNRLTKAKGRNGAPVVGDEHEAWGLIDPGLDPDEQSAPQAPVRGKGPARPAPTAPGGDVEALAHRLFPTPEDKAQAKQAFEQENGRPPASVQEIVQWAQTKQAGSQ